MIFNLKNPHEHTKYKEYVNKLFDQKAVVEVKKKNPQRSLAQNKYLYLLLGFFSCETGYSIDEVKLRFFKSHCNRVLFEEEVINKRGVTIKRLKSSADLSTSEMTTAIESFRHWSACEGIYLPAPNEQEFLLHIEQELERNKQYI